MTFKLSLHGRTFGDAPCSATTVLTHLLVTFSTINVEFHSAINVVRSLRLLAHDLERMMHTYKGAGASKLSLSSEMALLLVTYCTSAP